VKYSPWRTLCIHDFTKYACCVPFLCKHQNCSTNWGIGTSYRHSLLLSSVPVFNYYRLSILLHNIHIVNHKQYLIIYTHTNTHYIIIYIWVLLTIKVLLCNNGVSSVCPFYVKVLPNQIIQWREVYWIYHGPDGLGLWPGTLIEMVQEFGTLSGLCANFSAPQIEPFTSVTNKTWNVKNTRPTSWFGPRY
jgi:hypothetical protein